MTETTPVNIEEAVVQFCTNCDVYAQDESDSTSTKRPREDDETKTETETEDEKEDVYEYKGGEEDDYKDENGEEDEDGKESEYKDKDKEENEDEYEDEKENKDDKGILSSSIKSFQPSSRVKIRRMNINKLCTLLTNLVRHHNWVDASGVLSVLLQATRKEKSPTANKIKYQSAMEILKRLEGGSPKFRKMQNIFGIWMEKSGLMKNWQIKDRFAVHLEFIVYCIGQENAEATQQSAICLVQEREFNKDPVSNMVVGLTYCFSVYCVISEKLRLEFFDDSKQQNIHKGDFSVEVESKTSSRNEIVMEISAHAGDDQKDITNLTASQALCINSATNSCKEDNCIFCNQLENKPFGFDSWLMPFKLPLSDEILEELLFKYNNTLNDQYRHAITHLRTALYSSPPMYEALLPLVQMLLLGNHIDEALNELDKFCHSSPMVLAFKAKASLLEYVDGDNFSKLSACFEDILRKDPTCSNSLAKLISLHHKGEHIYSSRQLLEMIGLHLEAHKPQAAVWKEFASCFLKVCTSEEDQLCIVHEILTRGKLGRSWNMRCRWWLTLHFNHDILSSEIMAGDGHLLAYKAAVACHMYGQQSEYVLKACSYLEEHQKTLCSYLHKHMQKSVGFYSKIHKS